MRIWANGSFARAILLALLLVSIVPIFIISLLFINQSTSALTEQMESNLQSLVQAEAEKIDLRLQEVMHSTEMSADLAAVALDASLTEAEIAQRMTRYALDNRNLLGLDVFYSTRGGEEVLGTELSNVYWNNDTPLTDEAARQIAQTETLDPLFRSVAHTNPDLQWIYMTTTEGMMRLYPWASNDHYPDDWDPREIIFYTVAAPENNPSMQTAWTPAYVDFAGAGWMVTVSSPILDAEGEFVGIMSQDITIEALQNMALTINILDGAGYGFLIDKDGNIIAHPDYQDVEASEGTQETENLLTSGSPQFQALVQKMIAGESGLGHYIDESSNDQFLVYAPIPSIGWSLGIIVPETAVVAPATAMRSRVLLISLFLIALVSLLALLLARRIHHPIQQLLHGVHQLSAERRPDEIRVDSFRELRELADGFNEMTAKVWQRETALKKTVSELRIEIDMQRSQKEIQMLTETDYFQYLEHNAEEIRRNVRGLSSSNETKKEQTPSSK